MLQPSVFLLNYVDRSLDKEERDMMLLSLCLSLSLVSCSGL